jgi:hypothetical protein
MVDSATDSIGSDTMISDDAMVALCGDGTCSGNSGESCQGCATDCMTGSPVCGNGVCDAGEDGGSCYDDCGPITWPAPWITIEDGLLALVNAERASGTDCPTSMQNPVSALVRDAGMDVISRNHAWDLSHRNYSATNGTRCNGVSIFMLLQNAGYSLPRASATSIGGGTAAGVVAGWMSSNTLCPIVMDGAFTRLGAGHAQDSGLGATNATFN